MRIAALFLGLIAGLFALLVPSALHTDLMSPFLELWAANASEHLLGTIIWYAIPVAALLGGLLSTVTPGFAALLLLGAACGWVGIGLMLPSLLNFELLAPAGAAGLASVLAFLAGELEIRQRRMRRRSRRAATETLMDEGEIEREAALRIDPLVVPRDDLPPPPKHPIPLTLDDVSVTSRPASQPPRWQDLDAPSDRRRGPDMWAEAIRDEPAPEPNFEPEQEIEPLPMRGSTTRREFKWDADDAPAGQRRESGPPPGPRLEPRRAETPTPPPPLPQPPPRPLEPAQAAVAGESWPEPRIRRPIPVIREEPPRKNGVVAALAAFVAVLGLGAIGVGGYLAYREGWVDRLTAMVQPAPAPPAVASKPEPAKSEGPQPAQTATDQTPPMDAAQQAAAAAPPAAMTSPATPSAVQPAATTAAVASAEKAFDDPFAYCRAVGTIDYVDNRYKGPAMVEAITRALSLPASSSRDRVHWRCVRGALLACTSYAGPICDMAPTVEEMRAFCQRNPTVKQLLAPSGTWACVDGDPQLPEGATWPVDERGFLPLGWIVVRPDATPAG